MNNKLCFKILEISYNNLRFSNFSPEKFYKNNDVIAVTVNIRDVCTVEMQSTLESFN